MFYLLSIALVVIGGRLRAIFATGMIKSFTSLTMAGNGPGSNVTIRLNISQSISLLDSSENTGVSEIGALSGISVPCPEKTAPMPP